MARRPRKDQQSSAETPHSGEGFLARWSRRKRDANEEARLARAPPALNAPEANVPQANPSPPRAVTTDADLPPLESLDENSDYRDFLSPRVSEQLRRAALRKLFHSAKFNIVDGLDDYADDYYSIFHPLGDVMTAHQQGQRQTEDEKPPPGRAQEQAGLTQQEGNEATPAAGDGAPEDAAEKEPSTPVAHGKETPSEGTNKRVDDDA